jgi:hypothetical protein
MEPEALLSGLNFTVLRKYRRRLGREAISFQE